MRDDQGKEFLSAGKNIKSRQTESECTWWMNGDVDRWMDRLDGHQKWESIGPDKVESPRTGKLVRFIPSENQNYTI